LKFRLSKLPTPVAAHVHASQQCASLVHALCNVLRPVPLIMEPQLPIQPPLPPINAFPLKPLSPFPSIQLCTCNGWMYFATTHAAYRFAAPCSAPCAIIHIYPCFSCHWHQFTHFHWHCSALPCTVQLSALNVCVYFATSCTACRLVVRIFSAAPLISAPGQPI
jgi:hypothetical protein